MNETIIERILEMKVEHTLATGQEPTTIHIGTEEREALIRELRKRLESGVIRELTGGGELPGPKIWGMNIKRSENYSLIALSCATS